MTLYQVDYGTVDKVWQNRIFQFFFNPNTFSYVDYSRCCQYLYYT